jgi:hypothetical protein
VDSSDLSGLSLIGLIMVHSAGWEEPIFQPCLRGLGVIWNEMQPHPFGLRPSRACPFVALRASLSGAKGAKPLRVRLKP